MEKDMTYNYEDPEMSAKNNVEIIDAEAEALRLGLTVAEFAEYQKLESKAHSCSYIVNANDNEKNRAAEAHAINALIIFNEKHKIRP